MQNGQIHFIKMYQKILTSAVKFSLTGPFKDENFQVKFDKRNYGTC
jgi:hypothetical protein